MHKPIAKFIITFIMYILQVHYKCTYYLYRYNVHVQMYMLNVQLKCIFIMYSIG